MLLHFLNFLFRKKKFQGDHLLIDHRILQTLMSKKKLAIAPLLFAPFGDPPTVFISEDYNNRKEISVIEVSLYVHF